MLIKMFEKNVFQTDGSNFWFPENFDKENEKLLHW